jgi:hypothetical protein
MVIIYSPHSARTGADLIKMEVRSCLVKLPDFKSGVGR